ncbi:MAG: serine/threonine protein kinase, partial [Alistipes sp.]|nr:serine/threonine protein kinase [Alistipes sp.]
MMTTNLELPIGTTLRGASYTYTIERVLGQGTFGITYLATTKVKADGALGALEATLHVAIKEFFMHDLNGRHGAEVTCSSKSGIYEHYRHKFAREAQNLSKLHHANIVRVLESFEANNTAYYAMEFCEGGSLDALIGGDGLAEGQAVAYAEQIGAALVAMHGERVLHLDLKPGNVMLRKDGSVALIDFGLSKQYDESGEPESSTTVGGGTPGYAPLEQAHYREGKDFPVQMDVYALGATLFKMLTGERPAEAAMLLNEGFPTEKLTAKGVSELTIAVIAKAMSPMKRDRYGSVAEFLDALKGTADKQPIAPAPGEQTSYDDPAAEATVVDEEPEAVPTKEIKSESVTTEQ